MPCAFAGDTIPEFRVPEFIPNKYQRLQSDTQLVIPTLTIIHDTLVERLRRDPNELYNVRPRQFEELICNLLTRFGWNVELTPETKDGGYDIIGFSGSIGGARTSWIIECKKYASDRKVGVGVVRTLRGVKEQIKVANAIIVTTSTFTRGAQQLSNSRWDLSLRDYQDILSWVSSRGAA